MNRPTDPTDQQLAAGAALMRQFLAHSPYVAHLGIRLVAIEAGQATLVLPFNDSLVTVGSTVHGGAIASLIDTAALVAAWSDAPVPATPRGATVNLTVSYLAAAQQSDLRAIARVLRRGQTLVHLDVEVQEPDGRPVARGLVTYKIGRSGV